MGKEQRELLKRIISLYIMSFQLSMKNYWGREDYISDSQISKEIDDLEKEYTCKYGNIPEMNNIEEIYKIDKELKEE